MAEDIRPDAAVRAAKKWLADIYVDEAISSIALEEVRHREGNWEITLGFFRTPPADEGPEILKLLARSQRIYKVLVVAEADNHVMEMRDREVA